MFFIKKRILALSSLLFNEHEYIILCNYTYQSSSQNREITNKYVVVVVADCKLLLLLGVQFTNNTKVL